MKRAVMKLFAALLVFFGVAQCCAEGFAAGTLVKVPDGYARIERLCVGDRVICCDKEKNLVESLVVYTAQQSVARYARIHVGSECMCVASDQRLYDAKNDSWIAVSDLKNCDDVLLHDNAALCLMDGAIDLYIVGVAKHHNFFVTSADICAHNFFPPLVLAISAAFGASGIEIAGVSFGIAGLGGFLGYRWHKKNKKHNVVISPMVLDIAQERNNIYHADDAQAPGMPTEKDGFFPPKKWDGKKKTHPINGKVGWSDKKGKIWVPSGPRGHGGPHWDVQYPNGIDYDNVYPGGKIRPGR